MSTELSIEKFSPTQAELTTLVSNAEDAIVKFDPCDENSLELFKSRKRDLQQARIRITETGKELRADALKFQKEVIAREKEYLALITPTEDKMKETLDDLKRQEIRKERLAELPERRIMLAEIGDGATAVELADESLLDMDHDQFIAYLNERKAAHLDVLLAEQQRLNAERIRAEEIKAAEERVQREAEVALQRERQAREAAERQLKDEEDRRERARVAENERAKMLAENKRYNEWLDRNGFKEDSDEFYVYSTGSRMLLYKLIDTFTFEK